MDLEYVVLTDVDYRDMVVRMKGRDQWLYVYGKGWIETGIMIQYFYFDSPYYKSYEWISEDKARKIIEERGGTF